jgi:hypothetical protein
MPVILALLAVAFVVKFVWLLAAFATAAVIGRAAGWWLARRDDRTAAEHRRMAELCARADWQHAQVLAGDDRGIYGEYPPVE